MRKLRENIPAQLFIIYTRYLIGCSFVFASVVKIKGRRFTTLSGEFEPIDSPWHLFETLFRSGLYWKFLGLGQLVAGFLLITQRYSKLGALMFLPVVSNVFVITISYDFAYTPVITGLMLIANFMLVAWNWDEIKILVNKTPLVNTKQRFENEKIWEITGLALFLFTAIYRLIVNNYNIMLWFFVCVVIGATGLIFGLLKLRNLKQQVRD